MLADLALHANSACALALLIQNHYDFVVYRDKKKNEEGEGSFLI
jgi:hypothetical protein